MRTLASWPLALSLWVCLLVAQSLEAASFTLTPQQRDAALEMGRKSVIIDRFGGEWSVRGDGAAEGLVVMTPFYRLALASRNATFKNEELKQKDIDTLLKEQEGKLTLWATLKGTKVDFARFYTPVLVNGQQQIKATFAQNERTARREEDGGYTARCLYVFPADGLKPNEPMTLIVKDPDGKEVAKFALNLSAMR
ncbi:MAG TPA: hypothetical protein VMS64_29240 [Candidatus Methylomirabilis sp.]|nr:hypothetical protein [Candidatus Methylomirabilis sp.]